jgi:hypothetical protein
MDVGVHSQREVSEKKPVRIRYCQFDDMKKESVSNSLPIYFETKEEILGRINFPLPFTTY